MLEQHDPMCTWRFRAPNIKKGSHRANQYSEATEKAKVGAHGGNQSPPKTRVTSLSQEELFVPHLHGQTYQDPCLGDGKAEGGQGEDGGGVGKVDGVGGSNRDGVGQRVGEVRGQRKGRVNNGT